MWREWIKPALIALVVCVLVVGGTAVWFSKRLPPNIVTVDIQALVQAQQAKSTDEASVTRFAKRLSEAVNALQEDCDCVVLNKAALLAGPEGERTEWVRERVFP